MNILYINALHVDSYQSCIAYYQFPNLINIIITANFIVNDEFKTHGLISNPVPLQSQWRFEIFRKTRVFHAEKHRSHTYTPTFLSCLLKSPIHQGTKPRKFFPNRERDPSEKLFYYRRKFIPTFPHSLLTTGTSIGRTSASADQFTKLPWNFRKLLITEPMFTELCCTSARRARSALSSRWRDE